MPAAHREPRRFIAVEGCIGVGKTTLARGLAHALNAVSLLEETKNHPFIREFYKSPEAHAIETEIAFVLIHYHQITREQHAGTLSATVVSDFALERDYVFAALTLRREDDRTLFEQVYSLAKRRLPDIDLLLYLRAPTEFLFDRIKRRGRDFEGGLTREYLDAVNGALEQYFGERYQGRKLILDATALDSRVDADFVRTVAELIQREGAL